MVAHNNNKHSDKRLSTCDEVAILVAKLRAVSAVDREQSPICAE